MALRTPTVVAGSTTFATANVDDNLFAVTVPFAVSLYGVASTTITVTSNGVRLYLSRRLPSSTHTQQILAVASPVTTAYNNAALPQYSVCGTGLLAFWDDLIINAGRTQGIFWSSEGKSPSRSITFEFYESKYQAPDTYGEAFLHLPPKLCLQKLTYLFSPFLGQFLGGSPGYRDDRLPEYHR